MFEQNISVWCVFNLWCSELAQFEVLFTYISLEVDAAQMCSELTAYVVCRKHAHVDLVSEMDMTKALKLNGEMVLDKPIKVEKAKIKSAEKAKLSEEEKKGIDVTVGFITHAWKIGEDANSRLFPVNSDKEQQMSVSEERSTRHNKRRSFETLQGCGC